MNYPFSIYSWTVLSDLIAVKYMDKSSFLDKVIVIPQKKIAPFFDIHNIDLSERKYIKLEINDSAYKAYFKKDVKDVKGRIRLFWRADFAAMIRKRFPEYFKHFSSSKSRFDQQLQMYFQRIDFDRYTVAFLEAGVGNEDDIDDLAFQREVEKVRSRILPPGPQKPKKLGQKGHKRWKKDAQIAKASIIDADYRCEVDSKHSTFKSKVTDRNYIEAHHLIPMSFQDKFPYSLDVEANIVAVCPNCHKLLHHAVLKEKSRIIEKLLNNRKNRLQDRGIVVSYGILIDLCKQ